MSKLTCLRAFHFLCFTLDSHYFCTERCGKYNKRTEEVVGTLEVMGKGRKHECGPRGGTENYSVETGYCKRKMPLK